MVRSPRAAARATSSGSTAPVATAAPAAAASPAVGGPLPTGPAVLEAARKEGSVLYYTSIDLQYHATVAKAFAEKTGGVKLELQRLASGETYNRIMREYQSSLKTADVIEGIFSQFAEYKQKGMLTLYKPAEAAKHATKFDDPEGYYAVQRGSVYTLVYNTKLVTGADIPKSWRDAADPKWKGKISICSPLVSAGCLEQLLVLTDLYGWQYLEKLKANDVLVVGSAVEPVNKANAGERPLGIGGVTSNVGQLAAGGNPVAIAWPEEGNVAAVLGAGIVSNAPHPNAAKALIDFLHSPENQQLQADAYFQVPSSNVKLPPGAKTLAEIKLLNIPEERFNKENAAFKEKWKDLFGG